MLDIDIRFVKGALLVNLNGILNKENTNSIKKKLKDIIIKGGIMYLIINIKDTIIEEKVDLFDICNESIRNNNGKMYICGLKKEIRSIISSNFEFCYKINNELLALKEINLY